MRTGGVGRWYLCWARFVAMIHSMCLRRPAAALITEVRTAALAQPGCPGCNRYTMTGDYCLMHVQGTEHAKETTRECASQVMSEGGVQVTNQAVGWRRLVKLLCQAADAAAVGAETLNVLLLSRIHSRGHLPRQGAVTAEACCCAAAAAGDAAVVGFCCQAASSVYCCEVRKMVL